MVFGCFRVSLEEHGPGLTPLTAAIITSSSVMSGVLALSWMNLRQKSQRGSLSDWVHVNSSMGLFAQGLTPLKLLHSFSRRLPQESTEPGGRLLY